MSEETAAPRAGRPSEYSEEVALAVCARIADGESLRSVCRDEAMPAKSTIFKWLSQQQAFADQYARAMEARADAMFEDILEIADDSSGDRKVVGRDGEEREVCDTEFVQRARLRVDARKWMLGKMSPKKYGDKVALVGGGPDDAPLIPVLNVTIGGA